MEQHLTKEQILELYLNKIYLGNRAYGVGAAAQVYYGMPVDQLSIAQLAMVAGLLFLPRREPRLPHRVLHAQHIQLAESRL